MANTAEPPGSLLTGYGSAWEGQKCHLSSLVLQRPEDTTQLWHKDRRVISGRSLGNVFMHKHAQVQGVHAIPSMSNTSRAQKSG